IMFQGGARTVLEGPATLEIRSSFGVFLQQGKFTVTVEDPLVKGFEVLAPGMKYTDLGTEFGVVVAANGEQEVHVFRGKVEAEQVEDEGESGSRGDLEPPSSPPRPLAPSPPLVLTANQAIRVPAPHTADKPDEPIQRLAADAKQFVRADQVRQI